MNRAKLSLPRRSAAPKAESGGGELGAQTIAAELERLRGQPFSAAAVAAELGCSEEVAAELGEYLMPRGQRFHVRRLLAHIAAYLHVDATRLRELLGRGDQDLPPPHPHVPPHHDPAPRTPKVVVVHRRGAGRRAVNPQLSAADAEVGLSL